MYIHAQYMKDVDYYRNTPHGVENACVLNAGLASNDQNLILSTLYKDTSTVCDWLIDWLISVINPDQAGSIRIDPNSLYDKDSAWVNAYLKYSRHAQRDSKMCNLHTKSLSLDIMI